MNRLSVFSICILLNLFLFVGNSMAQNVIPGTVWVGIINPSHAPTNQNGNLVSDVPYINQLITTYDIQTFERVFVGVEYIQHTHSQAMSKAYEITCNCDEADLFSDISQNGTAYFNHIEFVPIDEPTASCADLPNDYGECGGFINEDWHLDLIKAPEAWDLMEDYLGNDKKISIAILEVSSSFDVAHEDFANADGSSQILYIMPGLITSPPSDETHATIVAGCAAAATNNNKGMSSIAGMYCNLMFFGSGYSRIYDAAMQGAKVINCSYINANCYIGSYGTMVMEMVADMDVIVVGGAGNGNDGANCDCEGDGLIIDADDHCYPASFPTALSVTGIDEGESFEHVSPGGTSIHSHNDAIDIAAPGWEVPALIPYDNYCSGCAWGTSFASPIVAGVCGLILTVNPCLTNEDIRTIITTSADNISSIGNNATYDAVHPGVGRVNAEAAVQMALDYGYQEYTINGGSTVTWNAENIKSKGIVVKSGGQLVIENGSEVIMQKGASLVVERGAKLIVDDSHITSGCGLGHRWQGIEVWGNSTISHASVFGGASPATLTLADYENVTLASNDPGMVILKNGAIIERAGNPAITTRRTDAASGSAYFGGIIYAEDADFLENRRAVEFMQYHHLNYSRFLRCNFTATEPTTFAGITVWDTDGILIDGCDFTTTSPNSYRIGVEARDAGLTIQNGCVFDGWKPAISVSSTMPLSASVNIGDPTGSLARNVFIDSEFYDIIADAAQNLNVYNNDFVLGSSLTAFGIVMNDETEFHIEGNSFQRFWVSIVGNNTHNGSNQIKCNDFVSGAIGIVAQGDNLGLYFDENDFFTNSDFLLTEYGTGGITGELPWQGDIDNPFFNLFTANLGSTNYHIGTGPNTEKFNYFYPDPSLNPRLQPLCDLDDLGCTTNYNYWAFDTGIGFYKGCLDLTQAPMAAATAPENCKTSDCLEAQKILIAQLESYIDGGDTEGLLFDAAVAPDADPTYQKYKDASPYLSDETLTEVAQNLQMAEWKRADILLSNAPLSEAVMDALNGNISTPNYNLLYAINYYVQLSQRDVLEAQISAETRKKEEALNHLVAKYADEKSYAQLQQLLEAESGTFAARALLGMKLQTGSFADAQSLLDALPEDTPEEGMFKDIQQINLQRLSNPNFELSQTEEDFLRAAAASYAPGTAHARGLMAVLKDEHFEPPFPDLTAAASSKTTPSLSPPALTMNDLQRLQISPNPARSHINVYIPPQADGKGRAAAEMTIYTVKGEKVKSIPTEPNQRMLQTNIGELPDGLYMLSYGINGKTLTQGKLLIAR